jgi:hypothetical protein
MKKECESEKRKKGENIKASSSIKKIFFYELPSSATSADEGRLLLLLSQHVIIILFSSSSLILLLSHFAWFVRSLHFLALLIRLGRGAVVSPFPTFSSFFFYL